MLSLHKKVIAAATASAYFTVNCVLLHAAESNLWAERRRAASAEPTQTAALSPAADPLQVLKGLPDLRPASLSPDVMERLSADVSPDVLRRHTALLAALPPAHVSVRRLSAPRKDGGRTVVFLQDVHHNDEAQQNLGKAVESLISADAAGRAPVSVVALESAFAAMDFSAYREPQDREDVRAAADHLLAEHQISGPVHTAYTFEGNLPAFTGVDDLARYNANIDAYRNSVSARSNARFQAASQRRRLENRKKEVFNDKLLAFDRSVSAYHAERLSFGRYVEALLSDGVPSRFAQASRFMDALRMENSLDFDRVEKERALLIEELVRRLSEKDMNALLELSVAYRMGAVGHTGYYKDLARLCRTNGVNLSAFPGMDAYLRYVILSGGIDADKLLKETQAAEAEGYARLAVTNEEKDLIAQSRRLALTAKLIEFSLTPDEWAEYQAGNSLSTPSSPNGSVGDPAVALSSFESFYKEADARNHAMTENILKAMDARAAKTAAFVAGGFHTTGMTRLLNDRGVTVIEAAPKLTKVDGSPSAYLSVFTQEKTPLEQLFKGNKLFVGDLANKAGESGTVAAMVALAKKSVDDAVSTFSRLMPGGRMTDVEVDEDRSEAVVETPAGKAKVSLRRTDKGLRFSQALTLGFFTLLAVSADAPVSQGVHLLTALTATSHLIVPALLYVSGSALGIVVLAVFRKPLTDFARRPAVQAASAVLLLLSLNGCTSPSAQPAAAPVDLYAELAPIEISAEGLLEALRNPDENARRKLVDRAVLRRWEDKLRLMEYFDSTRAGDLSRRRDVMLILSRLNGLRLANIPARLALLTDLPETDSYEKTVILDSLHGDKTPAVTEALLNVLKTVERGNGDVHMAAVLALGDVGGAGAVDALSKVLERPGRYTRSYGPTWIGFASRDGSREITPVEAELDFQYAAIQALGKMKADFEKAAPVLQKIANDPHQHRNLKAYAAEALKKLTAALEIDRYNADAAGDDLNRSFILGAYVGKLAPASLPAVESFMRALRDAAHTAMGRPMPLGSELMPMMTLRTPAEKRVKIMESLIQKDPASEDVLRRFNTFVDQILSMNDEDLRKLEDTLDPNAPSSLRPARRVPTPLALWGILVAPLGLTLSVRRAQFAQALSRFYAVPRGRLARFLAAVLIAFGLLTGCGTPAAVQPASPADESSEQQEFLVSAPELLERLRNPDENERKKLVEGAVLSLWLKGAWRESLPLMEFLDSTRKGDLSRRRDVMLILHRLGDLKRVNISARAALLADLPETASYEKILLLESLHGDGVPDASDAIVRVLKSVERGNGNVHMAAVNALGEVGGFDAAEALLKVLAKPGRYTRDYSPLWVSMSTRDGLENPRQLTPQEAEKDFQIMAVRALGKMRMDFDKITPVLEKIAGDPHQDRDLKAEAGAALKKVTVTREIQRFTYDVTVDDVARGHALMLYRHRQSPEAQAHVDDFMLALRDAAHTAMGRPMPLDQEQTPLMTLRSPAEKRAQVMETLIAKDPSAKEVLERFNTLVDKILPMSKEALDALEDLRELKPRGSLQPTRPMSTPAAYASLSRPAVSGGEKTLTASAAAPRPNPRRNMGLLQVLGLGGFGAIYLMGRGRSKKGAAPAPGEQEKKRPSLLMSTIVRMRAYLRRLQASERGWTAPLPPEPEALKAWTGNGRINPKALTLPLEFLDWRSDGRGKLSTRVANALEWAGIRTIGQLIALTELDVRKMRGMGAGSVDHLIATLAKHNFRLGTGRTLALRALGEKPVESLEWGESPFTQPVLERLEKRGVKTVAQLAALTDTELVVALLGFRDDLDAAKEYILQVMARYGLSLADGPAGGAPRRLKDYTGAGNTSIHMALDKARALIAEGKLGEAEFFLSQLQNVLEEMWTHEVENWEELMESWNEEMGVQFGPDLMKDDVPAAMDDVDDLLYSLQPGAVALDPKSALRLALGKGRRLLLSGEIMEARTLVGALVMGLERAERTGDVSELMEKWNKRMGLPEGAPSLARRDVQAVLERANELYMETLRQTFESRGQRPLIVHTIDRIIEARLARERALRRILKSESIPTLEELGLSVWTLKALEKNGLADLVALTDKRPERLALMFQPAIREEIRKALKGMGIAPVDRRLLEGMTREELLSSSVDFLDLPPETWGEFIAKSDSMTIGSLLNAFSFLDKQEFTASVERVRSALADMGLVPHEKVYVTQDTDYGKIQKADVRFLKGLSERVYNTLERTGVQSIGFLLSMTEADLMRLNGINKGSVQEIKRALGQINLTLKGGDVYHSGGGVAGAVGMAALALLSDPTAAIKEAIPSYTPSSLSVAWIVSAVVLAVSAFSFRWLLKSLKDEVTRWNRGDVEGMGWMINAALLFSFNVLALLVVSDLLSLGGFSMAGLGLAMIGAQVVHVLWNSQRISPARWLRRGWFWLTAATFMGAGALALIPASPPAPTDVVPSVALKRDVPPLLRPAADGPAAMRPLPTLTLSWSGKEDLVSLRETGSRTLFRDSYSSRVDLSGQELRVSVSVPAVWADKTHGGVALQIFARSRKHGPASGTRAVHWGSMDLRNSEGSPLVRVDPKDRSRLIVNLVLDMESGRALAPKEEPFDPSWVNELGLSASRDIFSSKPDILIGDVHVISAEVWPDYLRGVVSHSWGGLAGVVGTLVAGWLLAPVPPSDAGFSIDPGIAVAGLILAVMIWIVWRIVKDDRTAIREEVKEEWRKREVREKNIAPPESFHSVEWGSPGAVIGSPYALRVRYNYAPLFARLSEAEGEEPVVVYRQYGHGQDFILRKDGRKTLLTEEVESKLLYSREVHLTDEVLDQWLEKIGAAEGQREELVRTLVREEFDALEPGGVLEVGPKYKDFFKDPTALPEGAVRLFVSMDSPSRPNPLVLVEPFSAEGLRMVQVGKENLHEKYGLERPTAPLSFRKVYVMVLSAVPLFLFSSTLTSYLTSTSASAVVLGMSGHGALSFLGESGWTALLGITLLAAAIVSRVSRKEGGSLEKSAQASTEGAITAPPLGTLALHASDKIAPFWRGFTGKVVDALGRFSGRVVNGRSGALLLAGVLAVSSAEGRAVAGQEELLALAPEASSLGLNAFLSEKGGNGASAALLDHLNHPAYRFNPTFQRELAGALREKGVALDAPSAAAAVSRAAEREVSTTDAVVAAVNGTFLLTQVLRSEKDLPGLMALLAKHKGSGGHVQVLARDRGLESLVKAELAKLDNVSLDFRTSTEIPSETSRKPLPESVVALHAEPWLKALREDRGLRPGDVPFYVSYPADLELLEGDVPELFRQWNAERIRSFLEKAFKVQYQKLNDIGWVARLIAQMA